MEYMGKIGVPFLICGQQSEVTSYEDSKEQNLNKKI